MPVIENRHEPIAAPEHLVGSVTAQEPPVPGTCGRCGGRYSTRLMRSELVEYRLCRGCGRVWVERAHPPAATVTEQPRVIETVSDRLAAAVASFLRLLTVRRA